MNAKDRLIEKLLGVAKKYKILTYPVLALVAVISVFHYFFSWSTGAGKRVVAVVMVLVMLVSQSYFLTSSATALVDTEETVKQQQELQEQSGDGLVDTSDVQSEEAPSDDLVEAETTTELGNDVTDAEATETSTETTGDMVTSEDVTDAAEGAYTEDATTSDVAEDGSGEAPLPAGTENPDAQGEDEVQTVSVVFVAPKEEGGYGNVHTCDATVTAGGTTTTYTIASGDWSTADTNLTLMNVAGYVSFDGWYMDESCTVKITDDNKSSIKPGADGAIRLFAKKNLLSYKVTLDTVGGEITSVIGAQDKGSGVYSVLVGTDGTASFTLQGVKKTGYTISGASVTDGSYSGITTKESKTTGQDITIILKGDKYAQNVNLFWSADSYVISYAKPDGSTQDFNVEFDSEDLLVAAEAVGTVATARPGYEFSYWTLDAVAGSFIPNIRIANYEEMQKYIYEHEGEASAILQPYYTYKGVTFDKNQVEFQYKLVNQTGVTVVGKYTNKSGGENFTYQLTSEGEVAAATLESTYGIKVVLESGGIVFKTLENGPIKTNTTGIDVKFKVVDNNVADDAPITEKETEGTVKVVINQCAVTAAPSKTPSKTYDSTTECTSLSGNIPVTAGGNVVSGVYVAFDSCEYDSADAGENRKVILNNPRLVFDDANESGNYTLVLDGGECKVPGIITRRSVFVKTAVSYQYGRNYVRAGESSNPAISVIEDVAMNTGTNGFLNDDAKFLNSWVEWYLDPERLDANMKDPDQEITYSVLVRAKEASKNYNFVLNSADATATAKFTVKLEALTDNLYEIASTSSADGWYGGEGDIQLLPIATKGYNKIRISEDGAWQDAITLTEENTKNNQITFQLGDSSTGAFTAWKTIDVKIDKGAPEYVGYEVTQATSSAPGTGLYFPGVGDVTFGNFYNKTVTFEIEYKDLRSKPTTLYYRLKGSLGSGEWQQTSFDGFVEQSGATHGTAKFEILADAVDKIGTIEFYAVDDAGNKETPARTMTKNGDTWAVEQTGPKITSWGVKSGEISVISNSDRYYANCWAYLNVEDATSGVHGIVWYVNDYKIPQRVSDVTQIVGDAYFELDIDTETYPSEDGEYTVYAVVSDNAGNEVQTTDSYTFLIDDVLPVVDVERNYDNYQTEVKLEFDAYDELSGIQYIKVEDENGEADYTVEPAGKNAAGYDVSYCYMETTKKGTYHIEVADRAGNVYEEDITLDKVSNEIPPCPEVTFTPEVNEQGWITSEEAQAIISNVTETTEDKTPVETKYQLWRDGESSLNVTTISDSVAADTVSIPNGIYKLLVWSESKTGVLCDGEEDKGHLYTIQVDSIEPTIEYKLTKGADNSLVVTFTVTDDISGVDGESIQVMKGATPITAQITALEDESGYTGSFTITETGNYSIVAKDIAGNEADSDAFTPMSMKVNAIKNITASSATVGARVIKGSYPIKSASISYRKYADATYTETEVLPVVDEVTGNWAVSSVLNNLEKGTAYVYKVTAVSEVDEVLEYTGLFRTLSDDENGITVSGTARYADGRKGYITVGLFEGTSCIRAVEVDTSESNAFTFYNIPDGNYNVVATDGTYSNTERLTINNGVLIYPNTGSLDLVLSGKNTSVVVTTDETPDVTADNMDSLFIDGTNYTEDDKLLVESGEGTVEFRLTATLMKVSNVQAGEITAMYNAASSRNKLVGMYIDLSLYKIVTDEFGQVTKTQVHELGGGANVSVTIPLGDLANKSGLEVVRIHQNGDNFLGAYLPDQDNNPNTYTISSSMFSTYALLYDPEKEEPATEEIKDGTLDPSADGTLTDGDENPGDDIPEDDDPDDKNDTDGKDNPDDKKNNGGSSVGSLTSSGSAKTGDATPITLLFGMMITALGALFVLRKKA